MIINNPCRWVGDRLDSGFFTIRINDGEMLSMYRQSPENSRLATDITPTKNYYAWGDALRDIFNSIACTSGKTRQNILVGCSWNTPRADYLCDYFRKDLEHLELTNLQWTHEHWPLQGVVDNTIISLLDKVSKVTSKVLLTCDLLIDARYCLNAECIEVSRTDSWLDCNRLYPLCKPLAEKDYLFLWAGGGGLKPLAWKLWSRYPNTQHIDLGHLFNGSLGLMDYGWLQRKEEPWYTPYFNHFAPWVRSFIH